MSINIKLSKKISYALRHAPWEFELELDENGFVEINQLLEALREEKNYKGISRSDIVNVVNSCDKGRFEIVENKIRALYGHSISMKIKREKSQPPQILYHGTTRGVLNTILKEGLKPRGRQYVHCSVDTAMANQVGKRRDSLPCILKIDALKAYEEGVPFYKGNDNVWLADFVDPKYISY